MSDLISLTGEAVVQIKNIVQCTIWYYAVVIGVDKSGQEVAILISLDWKSSDLTNYESINRMESNIN